jgi:hypothetical protein
MPIVEGDTNLESQPLLDRSRRIRINNIRMNLLEQLKPLLVGKDLKIILPFDKKPTEELRKLGEIAGTKIDRLRWVGDIRRNGRI